MRAHRVVIQRQTVLDASGAGLVDFVPPGVEWATQITAVLVTTAVPNPPVSTSLAYINGTYVEGSENGNNDSSDSRFVLNPGDDYQIRWSGGPPGAIASATLTAIQYPVGQAPAE